MTKFIFNDTLDKNAIILSTSGEHEFNNNAIIGYYFNTTDKDIKILIDNYYFTADGLTDLIDFLQSAKTHIESLK